MLRPPLIADYVLCKNYEQTPYPLASAFYLGLVLNGCMRKCVCDKCTQESKYIALGAMKGFSCEAFVFACVVRLK